MRRHQAFALDPVLKFAEPLSNFAFNFNLRRYNQVMNSVDGLGDLSLHQITSDVDDTDEDDDDNSDDEGLRIV